MESAASPPKAQPCDTPRVDDHSTSGDRSSGKPGRPFALDDVKRGEICALLTAGCSIEWAANFVGCSPNTIRRESRRNPEFGARIRQAALQAKLRPLQAIKQAADKNWRAAAWMLDRQNPKRTRRRPYYMTMRQMGKLMSRIDAILAEELTSLRRDRVMRYLKNQVIELTELV
jgi:hypothetical protein